MSRTLPRTIAALVALLLPGTALAAGGGALNLIPDPAILAGNLVVFTALIYPVNRLLIAPLVRVLLERERRAHGNLSRAANLREQAAAQLADLETRLRAARARAHEQRARILAEAEVEERRILEAARADAAATVDEVRTAIAAELDAVRSELQAESRSIAAELASRILGRAA